MLKPIRPLFRAPGLSRATPAQALRSVTSKSGLGVYASSDTLFKGAVFGRDSLEVAEDLMAVRGKLVEKILLTLASLQGETYNPDNEEEPGKIIHEYRTSRIDGKQIDENSAKILRRLSQDWGGSSTQLAYYGSVDATPLFVRTVFWYCSMYGRELLSKRVQLRSGHVQQFANIVDNALDWIISKLESSGSGLIEYHRVNPKGLANQVWKDSVEFYIHNNGTPANHDKPIASIEVQALTYDALRLGAQMISQRSEKLDELALKLRNRMLELLWLPQIEYFALGTDYDEEGELRLIETITANPAEMLDSTIFDDLPPEQAQRYISGIVRRIMGTEFLTDAGIRSRSLQEAKLVSFWDYHGSYTSWPKETYDIAKGLRRQGMPKLAHELENRLLNLIKAMKSFPEFVYVDYRGRVLGMPNTRASHGEMVFVEGPNMPEKVQAWTVSAIVAINSVKRRRFSGAKHGTWQHRLEKEVLSHIPHMPVLKSQKELAARYPTYPYQLADNQMVQ
jgi:glycogen debranching enzyme